MKIATTGMSGLVGSRVRDLLNNEFEFIGIPHNEVDITNVNAVKTYMRTIDADMLLHLAAFTNVDACEVDKETAWNVNVEGTRNLFEASRERNIKFIYMSTGFVFDGETPPFFEDSKPNPLSYYGRTKYEGEKIVDGNGMIIRIDYPYGSSVDHKKDVVTSILDGLREKKPLKGITDQIFTPTYIDDIAEGLRHLLNHFSPQTIHLVGADSLSGYDVIKTIGEVFDVDTGWIGETTYSEYYENKAQRPRNNTIKSHVNTFYPMKTFKEGLIDLRSRR